MQLATELCGLPLAHPVMNAAGTCKLLEQFEELIRTDVAAGTVGSFTMEEREKRQDQAFWRGPHFSLNAMRLPNPGRSYYEEHLPEMKRLAEAAGKPLKASVAGFSTEEFGILAGTAYHGGADLIELDFGSMTVWAESNHQRIITFKPELIRRIWRAIFEGRRVSQDAKVGVKLAPISDPMYLAELTGVLAELGVAFITTSNTFPNGSGSRESAEIGYAGVGGPALRPIALGQVKQFSENVEALEAQIDIVGVGGVELATHVLDLLEAGATAVEVATGRENIDPIARELRRHAEHV